MNRFIIASTLIAAFTLAACDKPTVITPPAAVVAVPVPGPAGPTGATGSTGSTGSEGMKGDTGKTGSGTTINVMPAASAPSN